MPEVKCVCMWNHDVFHSFSLFTHFSDTLHQICAAPVICVWNLKGWKLKVKSSTDLWQRWRCWGTRQWAEERAVHGWTSWAERRHRLDSPRPSSPSLSRSWSQSFAAAAADRKNKERLKIKLYNKNTWTLLILELSFTSYVFWQRNYLSSVLTEVTEDYKQSLS